MMSDVEEMERVHVDPAVYYFEDQAAFNTFENAAEKHLGDLSALAKESAVGNVAASCYFLVIH